MSRRKPKRKFFTTVVCPFCGYVDSWARGNHNQWVCKHCDELVDEGDLNNKLAMGFAEGVWEETDV